MDKTTLKLDKSDPGLYIVRIVSMNSAKNNLQEEILKYFRNSQHLALLQGNLVEAYIREQKSVVERINNRHLRCHPVALNHTEAGYLTDDRQLYTDFLTVSIQRCKRLITEVNLETEQSACIPRSQESEFVWTDQNVADFVVDLVRSVTNGTLRTWESRHVLDFIKQLHEKRNEVKPETEQSA